jgi:hypothetical protein
MKEEERRKEKTKKERGGRKEGQVRGREGKKQKRSSRRAIPRRRNDFLRCNVKTMKDTRPKAFRKRARCSLV